MMLSMIKVFPSVSVGFDKRSLYDSLSFYVKKTIIVSDNQVK